MRSLPAVLGLVLLAASPETSRAEAGQTMTPAPGVPLDVATRRAAIVSNLRYDLSL